MLPRDRPPASPLVSDPEDAPARRTLAVVCAIYLVLVLAQAIAFMSGDLGTLSANERAASQTLADEMATADADDLAEAVRRDEEYLATLALQDRSFNERLGEADQRVETVKGNPDATAAELTGAEATRDDLRDLQAANHRSRDEVRTRLDTARRRQQDLATARSDLDTSRSHVRRGWLRLAGFGLAAGVLGYFLLVQRRRVRTRQEVVTNAAVMIILLGVVLLASRLVLQKAIPNLAAWGLLDVFVLHAVACLIMPWTAREAVIPFAPLLLVWAMTFLVPSASDLEILDRVVGVIVSPAVLVPGALLAAWRTRRREEEAERLMLGRQVRSLGGELSRARIVHDAMFPDPRDTGHVVFEYEYLPIAEIGGDYVHLHVCPETERVYLTLLDVAGHGLAAALTVNRLFGELERIRAEDAHASPADVITLLNRYISLTMARHDLYATSTCLMLDPNSGSLVWANAGHPPAFLRRADGEVTELACTTVLLGALQFDEFRANEQTSKLHPGDVVIAYTDGTFEARDQHGRCFGLDSLRRTAHFSPPPRHWPRFILHAVTSHHDGHADDDILIASLMLRSLRVARHRQTPAEAVAVT